MDERESTGREGIPVRPRSSLRPQFDDTTLFLLAVSFILACAIPSGPTGYMWRAFTSQEQDADLIQMLLGIGAVGLLLILYHAVAMRQKHPIEKGLMGGFAVLVNAAASVSVALPMLESREFGLSALFPIVNLASAVLLLYSFGDHDLVADDNASPIDLLIGTSALIVVFVVCVLVARTSWAVTFSACVAYSTLAHRFFTHVPIVVQALSRRRHA